LINIALTNDYHYPLNCAQLSTDEKIMKSDSAPKSTHKTKVVVIGAGKIGETIVALLLESNDFHVTLLDSSEPSLAHFADHNDLTKRLVDVSDASALDVELKHQFAVLSSTPYFLTTKIADAAFRAGCHYLDLTEDVASTAYVRALADKAQTAFIPQCGLAPGFISIVTNQLASTFDKLETIRMCVGALPQFPSNSLNYNLTWSTDGVINEYCESCVAIVDGVVTTVPALEHLEHISLDGIQYEMFNTSGGIGSLGESLKGKVKNLAYKTIRYPGHRDIMKTLLHDLGLRDRRDLLKDVLENAVPATMQDVVLIFVTVSGIKNGQLMQETYANKVYGREVGGVLRSGIQITTAGSICAVLDLLRLGAIKARGFVTQEEIGLDTFLNNRFGQVYKSSTTDQNAAHKNAA
jgi:saccharopine dehydrogenase-like NADP-dependent oxidoreductase